MSDLVKNIIVVGGGSSGWLVAAIIAAERLTDPDTGISITLIESPNIATIGVGEGTWPTMRETLRKIGVSEAEFISECDASFKQGSKFIGWASGKDDYYYHPFTLPEAYGDINLAPHWAQHREKVSFVDAVCPQGHACDRRLAPKQIQTPEFAYNLNYGYHLNAGKFSEFLRKHSVGKLGVTHIRDDVVGVVSKDNGDIKELTLKSGRTLPGDLFVDCTGFSSLLIGNHYQIPCVDKSNVLFNDSALTTPAPYPDTHNPVSSCTTATAQRNGWIWDIGLSNRRGVGYVFSSSHTTDETARQELEAYLRTNLESTELDFPIRKIQFSPKYRQIFWHKNCVAIGLSAGFIEPLEATALVLVELSAQMLAAEMPANRGAMTIVAKRFNKQFQYHWERSIDFLKLHYALTSRTDTDYWRDHTASTSIPESLQDLLTLWENRSPWMPDSTYREEMFSSASFQYVLYGMKPASASLRNMRRNFDQETKRAEELFKKNILKTRRMLAGLPENRNILDKIREHGFQKA